MGRSYLGWEDEFNNAKPPLKGVALLDAFLALDHVWSWLAAESNFTVEELRANLTASEINFDGYITVRYDGREVIQIPGAVEASERVLLNTFAYGLRTLRCNKCKTWLLDGEEWECTTCFAHRVADLRSMVTELGGA